MTNFPRQFTLEFNCGFARAAVRELTPKTHGKQTVDKSKRAQDFKQLFADADYVFPEAYFDGGKNGSPFDRNCNTILRIWNKKWHPPESRLQYESIFSVESWKALPHKGQHTLARCQACLVVHGDIQRTFPEGPHYEEALLSEDEGELRRIGRKQATVETLTKVNTLFSQAFDATFTELLLRHGKQNLQRKPTALEKKQHLRKIYRHCRDKENEALTKSTAIAVLTEDESMRAYQRKRRQQYFEKSPPTKQAKPKSHSPDFSNVVWDKDQVLSDLQQHLQTPHSAINWSQFARDHAVPGKNAGQVLKEFAHTSGIDTSTLDGKELGTYRTRVHKRRLVGGEISAGSTPTPAAVREEWKKLVETGELSLGNPCVPYKMMRFATKEGQLIREEVTITGRKFPLIEIRQHLLDQHEKYMRLNTDAEIDNMSFADICTLCKLYHHQVSPDASVDNLRALIKHHQRNRSLILWHDHGTLLGLGCILMTVHVAYDPGVFYTHAECQRPNAPSVQSVVEQPAIYLLAAGSSSAEDQVALLQDRIDCLLDLPTELNTSKGIKIRDKLKFFIGDHPAQQFERGTQQGGTYKCGSCGVKDFMMQDMAHTLHRPRRSLQDLQHIATVGQAGKQPGNLKPFSNLRVAALREELCARGQYDFGKKADMRMKLDDILCGVQRVPTLLLLDPQQPLERLDLDQYTVLDCEPLHDIKGHFSHLLEELPFLLGSADRAAVEEIIKATTSNTMTGAKYRVCMIEVLIQLRKQPVSKEVIMLVETAVQMSHLLYMPEAERNPRNILRLYNCSWLHHELSCMLITNFHKKMTAVTFFGTYLHSLVIHAPLQMEIISLQSVNTENQERIFEQARRSATAASNRHPQNVLSSTILRLQAKAAFKEPANAQQLAHSIVSKASASAPKYLGTEISKSFLSTRLSSWQAHLKRLAHYLAPGKGVWWEDTSSTFHFFDGCDHPEFQPEGPHLRHFRSTTMEDVTAHAEVLWKRILQEKTAIPTTRLLLFDASDSQLNGDEVSATTHTEQLENVSQDMPPTDYPEVEQSKGPADDNEESDKQSSEGSEEFSLVVEDGESTQAVESTPVYSYRTKHGTEIGKVLGNTEEVKQFDRLRHALKTAKKISQQEKEYHDRLLCKLQLAVQHERTRMITELGTIDKQYYQAHGKLPENNDHPQHNDLTRKCNHITKLLHSWNIIS